MRFIDTVMFCGLAIVVGFMGLAFVSVPSWFHVAGVALGGFVMFAGIYMMRAD